MEAGITFHDLKSDALLLFEMSVGFPPFFGKNPFTVYKKILECKPPFPSWLQGQAKAAISGFLSVNRAKRLGCGKAGFSEVKRHPFFRGVEWSSALAELMVPPLIPSVQSEGDSSNYDSYPDEQADEASNLTQAERELFRQIDALLERPVKLT